MFWIERYCRLYEGEWAGEPMRLRGLHEVPSDWTPAADFDEKHFTQRATDHAAGVCAGKPADWQFEFFMRCFGWQRDSARWKRPVRRFRRASVWIAKKNKKSPTLAALGLELTAGDGEQGQKVFVGAKDGSQARDNVGEHVRAMLEQSPELLSECAFNLSKMRLTHLPSRSFLQPLSSSNVRTQKSKEGLNGSVLVDETHVVDREFIARVDRAGISRAEPLHAEFSTAGDNPDSYGKEQFDYACKIAAGLNEAGQRITDLQFLAMPYAPPQTIEHDEFKADPVKYGRMANPAWGHTIDEEEYLSDFRRSQKTTTDFNRFLMYRANIWQHGEQTWLKSSDWKRGETDYRLDEWEGYPCVLSLDKSKTRDMTAIVVTFEQATDEHAWRYDDRHRVHLCLFCGEMTRRKRPPKTGCPDAKCYFQYPFFFLPEATARAQNNKAPFLDWAEAGEIELIPGEVIQDGYLKRRFKDLHERFEIQNLFFDQTYAEDITQWCEEELGVPRISVDQTSAAMSDPIDVFERLLSQNMIYHGESDCLDWQARNANTKINSKGQQILVKPTDKDDVRKIDGIVACVIGIAGILRFPVTDSYYEHNEVEFI